MSPTVHLRMLLVLAVLGCGPSADPPSTLAGCEARDVDQDGVSACDDCDDDDPTVHPGAVDTWYDGVDSDCDGADDFDQDGDGARPLEHGGSDCDDEDPALNTMDEDGDTWTTCQGDCADDDRAVLPMAERVCNGVDDDCDGVGDCHPLGSYSFPSAGASELLAAAGSLGPLFGFPAGQDAGPVMAVRSDLGTGEIYLLPSHWTGTLLTSDAVATFPGIMYDYADVTGDGVPDIVTFSDQFAGNDPVHVYPGPHAGTYELADAGMVLSPAFGSQEGILAFDHDNDGRYGVLCAVDDIADLNFGTPYDRALYFVAELTEGAGPESVSAVLHADTADGVLAAVDARHDMLGDGVPDLVVVDYASSETYILSGPSLQGTHALRDLEEVTLTNCFGGTPIGDLNGDGYSELRCYGGELQNGILFGPLLYDKDGLSDSNVMVIGGQPKSPGDVDGDGHADLLVMSQSALRLYYGPFPDGTVLDVDLVAADATFDTIDTTTAPVRLGDSDGDGYADFLVGGSQGYYRVQGGPSDAF